MTYTDESDNRIVIRPEIIDLCLVRDLRNNVHLMLASPRLKGWTKGCVLVGVTEPFHE